jgi:hypothetical protein
VNLIARSPLDDLTKGYQASVRAAMLGVRAKSASIPSFDGWSPQAAR